MDVWIDAVRMHACVRVCMCLCMCECVYVMYVIRCCAGGDGLGAGQIYDEGKPWKSQISGSTETRRNLELEYFC